MKTVEIILIDVKSDLRYSKYPQEQISFVNENKVLSHNIGCCLLEHGT